MAGSCWFCGENRSDDKIGHKLDFFRIVDVRESTVVRMDVSYETKQVTLPCCKSCLKLHQRQDYLNVLIVLGVLATVVGSTFIVYKLLGPGPWKLLGALVITIISLAALNASVGDRLLDRWEKEPDPRSLKEGVARYNKGVEDDWVPGKEPTPAWEMGQ